MLQERLVVAAQQTTKAGEELKRMFHDLESQRVAGRMSSSHAYLRRRAATW